jgi:hypothetical protein
VVDVVACQTGDTLLQILDNPATEEQVRGNSDYSKSEMSEEIQIAFE